MKTLFTRPAHDTSFGRRADPSRRPARLLPLALLVLALVGGCNGDMSLHEVRELQASGRYADTIDPLRERLELTPDDPETHLLYGMALSRTGAARVAVWSLRKAAESPEWKVPATLELASTQSRAGNWAAAIEAAETVLAIEPDNLDAHILRGESLLSQGEQPERALEDFEIVLDQDPTSLAAATSKASALLMAGRIDEAAAAIDELETLVEKDPAEAESQAQLCAVQSLLRQERGELDEAKKVLEDCLHRFPANAVVIHAALRYFDAHGDRPRGDAILGKALEVAPAALSYRETLSQRLAESGDGARALAVLKEGLESSDPNLRSAVWTDITNYHLKRDDLPKAIAAFEQALALVPDPPQVAILTHADLLARAGRHADALRVAKGLDNDAYVGLIEARIALDERDPKRALARLDQVFPVWPNNAGARYYAARAAEQMGNFARAIDEYRQSMRSSAEETEAALRLAKLYLAAGANEEAWNNATQYINVHRDDPEGVRVVVASAAQDEKSDLYAFIGKLRATPKLWPAAVAARAQFLAEKKNPAAALEWLAGLPGPAPDWTLPVNAEALRARVLLLHSASRGVEAEKLLATALAAHPDDSAFHEIQAALLEASGGDPAAVRGAFEDALAKDGRNWLALEGVARSLERAGDVRAAIAFYDRSTGAHPESPAAAERTATLATRLGEPAEAEKRWDSLVREHPWNAHAARALAKIRSDRGQNDAATLDYAERAVMFGEPGEREDAGALLVAIHEARGEHPRAAAVAKALAEGRAIPPRKSMPGPPG